MGAAHPSVLQEVFSHVAQRMDPQQYADHVTPGAGGTNPLGSIGSGGLATIASALLGKLQEKYGYAREEAEQQLKAWEAEL